MEQRFRGLYGIASYVPIAVAVEIFVKEVKAALINLKHLPTTTPLDGNYDNEMLKAIKAFQVQINMKESGLLSGTTYQGLFEQIMKLRAKLIEANVDVPTEDPFKNYEIFTKCLQDYEKRYNSIDVKQKLEKNHKSNSFAQAVSE